MDEDTKNLHPVEVLIEELKCEDVSRRVISVKTLNTIAIALGPKQTREELLPYLLELLDDENQVLIALAEALRYLIQSIGGPKHAYVLFDLIEQLLQIDEQNIRMKTLDSFQLIIKQANSKCLQKVVLDLAKRLCASDKVPAKIAAAYLIPISISSVTEKKVLIDQFKVLMLCSHPQVRIAAGENLKNLVWFNDYIAELLNIATIDQEDSVRYLALEALLMCGDIKGLITSVTALFEDDYFKVKQKISENISEISKFICGRYDLILDYFCRAITDKEIEVRLALCSNISSVFKVVPKEQYPKYLENLTTISGDSAQVKVAVAQELNKIWPYTGEHEVLTTLVKELISSYSPQIYLNLIQDLQYFCQFNSNYEPTITLLFDSLSKDKVWRIRQRFSSNFFYISEKMGKEFFSKHLKSIFFSFWTDSAFSIRESIKCVLVELIGLFGKAWFEEEILVELLSLQHAKNYLWRMSFLSMAKAVLKILAGGKAEDKLEKGIFFLLGDVVCNVRAYAIKSLGSVYEIGSYEKRQMIKNSLSILQQDEDVEVRNLAFELYE